MPEGPEVAIISEGLNNLLKDKEIIKFTLSSRGRYKTKAPDGFSDFKKKLPTKVTSVKCKGKFIYWEFASGHYMHNTLGLSGVWTKTRKNNTVCRIKYCDPNTKEENKIYFDDVRHFGTLKFVNTKKELDDKLATLGIDVLNDPAFTRAKFRHLLKKQKDKNITVVLVNMGIISGVGNYLKSEVLYDAKVSPHRTCDNLKDIEMSRLYDAIKEICKESYDLGGMSRKDYADINNKKGTFGTKLQVYGKKTDSKGNTIISETTKDKRTTFWVKEVQK